MCVQENDTFSRKFEDGVVFTMKITEHPGQILGKTHEKSKYRQGGFLTVDWVSLPWQPFEYLDSGCSKGQYRRHRNEYFLNKCKETERIYKKKKKIWTKAWSWTDLHWKRN